MSYLYTLACAIGLLRSVLLILLLHLRSPQEEVTQMIPYQVTVRRRGSSPLTLTMLVGAESREDAAGLATGLAEHERGGMFEAGRVRVAPDATELDMAAEAA
jgi:hypothetical protein